MESLLIEFVNDTKLEEVANTLVVGIKNHKNLNKLDNWTVNNVEFNKGNARCYSSRNKSKHKLGRQYDCKKDLDTMVNQNSMRVSLQKLIPF